DLIWMATTYGMFWVGAADKRKKVIGKQFDETRLVPHDDDAKHNKKIDDKHTVPEWDPPSKRGWGTVAFGFYEPILARLQSNAWSPAVKAAFDLPVHAMGYNWSASNGTSGKKLKEYVGEVKKKYKANKVIVVTHSMGGLVTGGALWIHSMSSDVAGVVHGVMPATGAGTLYWRMKGGLERTGFASRIAAWVLGVNGEETVAMVGNMPGGLQLLPSKLYTDNKNDPKWLQFADFDHVVKTKRPETGDPYEEIYKNKTDYWRAVDPAYLNPGKKPGVGLEDDDADWGDYETYVDTAKDFHEKVKMEREVPCESFYGTGKVNGAPTTDRVVYSVEEQAYEKKGDTVVKGSLRGALSKVWSTIWGAGEWIGKQATSVGDWWHSRGGFTARVVKGNASIVARLDGSDGTGDATVAESSGRAVKGRSPKEFEGIEHGDAYKVKEVLDYTAAMVEKFCIEKIKKETGG
ncbi:MAG TPA: hypothetical protein VIG99_21255, partial [Myxococcaceae bacterium]